MSLLARILIGLPMTALGFVLVWKTEWFQYNVGSIAWAEEKLGSMGGSRFMYKIIGIVLIIVAFLMMTNLHKAAFIGLFGWLFPGLQPQEPGL
jgi:hypothetical protein